MIDEKGNVIEMRKIKDNIKQQIDNMASFGNYFIII